MQNSEQKEKIERYIKGLSDETEKKWVESQFLKGEDNIILKHLLKDDWDLILKDSSVPEVKLNRLLDQVHHIIRKKETLNRQRPIKRYIRIYTRVAAILLIPLMIAGGLIYRYSGNYGKAVNDQKVTSTIYAPLGARVSFNLPDGTIGMLNSGSRLTYSLPFMRNRLIELEGEAWFEVKHDEDDPFKINAGKSTITVLGTSLNVNAYPDEEYVEVVLQKGKVEFQNGKNDKSIIMQPSERLVLMDGSVSQSVIDPEKYISWTGGMLIFKGDPMEEVARRIERWYNIKIIIADSSLKKYSFRATFQDDKLQDVLRFLSMTSPIRYKIAPAKIMSDGTYKKEEVTIYQK